MKYSPQQETEKVSVLELPAKNRQQSAVSTAKRYFFFRKSADPFYPLSL